MKKLLNTYGMLGLAVLLVFSFSSVSAQTYTGVKVCGACHKGDKNHKVLEKWQATKHATAFETLKGEEAKKIAKKMGIADPTTADACLKCHVTNGGKGKGIKMEDGVSCEACHGAGSDYKSKAVMENREMAIKKGMVLGTNDEALCKKCHNPESPTYKKFVYATDWAKVKHPTK